MKSVDEWVDGGVGVANPKHEQVKVVWGSDLLFKKRMVKSEGYSDICKAQFSSVQWLKRKD